MKSGEAVTHPVARLPEEWADWAKTKGERPFRAKEIFRWIQARGVLDPAKMTSLPAPIRDHLAAEIPTPTASR